jgi:predicted Zn-dependent protease
MNRFLCFLVLLPTLLLGQGNPAETDGVMRAMTDELQRSVTELQFRDLEKPYFIQYSILDEEVYTAQATFGALASSNRTRQRVLQTQVRVGDYTFDNSEFVPLGQGGGAAGTGVTSTIAIDNDYNALRHSLWLSTDAAYKQSVEQLARKRAFVQNKIQDEQVPDFSQEKPLTAIAPMGSLNIDRVRWEKELRNWSAILREFPKVQQSNVSLQVRLMHRYIVNSEGTRTLQPSVIVALEAVAGMQSPDGLSIAHSVPFYSRTMEQLPSPEVFAEAIRKMATDLTMVHAAPVLDKDYSGPVLLTGQASTEMFARVLAPDLSGQRPPMFERQQGNANQSELMDRMNRPVLPSYMSVFDDPTQPQAGGLDLIGHYQLDEQGVPARRVSLIEDGLLKELLMSRRPRKDVLQSNGHGRSGFPGRESAQIGNLFIEVTAGKTYEQLKQALIELCVTEKLDYGIVIKAIYPDGRSALGTPVLAYKVYVTDGREELIRGASLDGISVRSLRQIEAAGDDRFVANRLSGNRGNPTPVSVVAPSVLLQEMELKRPFGTQQKPALLTHPYFEGTR